MRSYDAIAVTKDRRVRGVSNDKTGLHTHKATLVRYEDRSCEIYATVESTGMRNSRATRQRLIARPSH